MHPLGIITIIIISCYLLAMTIYFGNRLIKGKGLVDECDSCASKGKKLIKYYYKQKKKEEKIS